MICASHQFNLWLACDLWSACDLCSYVPSNSSWRCCCCHVLWQWCTVGVGCLSDEDEWLRWPWCFVKWFESMSVHVALLSWATPTEQQSDIFIKHLRSIRSCVEDMLPLHHRLSFRILCFFFFFMSSSFHCFDSAAAVDRKLDIHGILPAKTWV